jgi:PAS domain-containing protein
MDMPDETNLTAILRRRIADAILDAAGDAIIACDADGIIRFWNLGASRIFGFDAGEAVGQSLDIIIPERLRTRHWEGFRKMVTTGQSRYPEGHLLSVNPHSAYQGVGAHQRGNLQIVVHEGVGVQLRCLFDELPIHLLPSRFVPRNTVSAGLMMLSKPR